MTLVLRRQTLFLQARFAVLVLLVSALGCVMAPRVAKADENWVSAQKAFEICLRLFPDVNAIQKALKDDGWRYEGSKNSLKIHSKNGYRAVAATQDSRQNAGRCFVSSSGLSPDEAMTFATDIADQLENSQTVDLTQRGVVLAWEGTLRGQKLRLGVLAKLELGVMRGAGIVLGEF